MYACSDGIFILDATKRVSRCKQMYVIDAWARQNQTHSLAPSIKWSSHEYLFFVIDSSCWTEYSLGIFTMPRCKKERPTDSIQILVILKARMRNNLLSESSVLVVIIGEWNRPKTVLQLILNNKKLYLRMGRGWCVRECYNKQTGFFFKVWTFRT